VRRLAIATAATLSTVAAAADYSPQEVREVSQRYAACVIKRSPGEARRFVVESERRAPVIGDCLNEAMRGFGAEMRFPPATYRYAMAEALIVRDYAAGVPQGIATAAALTHEGPDPLDETRVPKGKRGVAMRDRHRQAQGFAAMDVFTDCVVRANPQGSLALVKAGLGNPGETAAFTTLKPALAGCLPPGNTINFNRSVLRGSLAYNLYRMSYAVRPVA